MKGVKGVKPGERGQTILLLNKTDKTLEGRGPLIWKLTFAALCPCASAPENSQPGMKTALPPKNMLRFLFAVP
jgi:hypothetical protein